MFSATLIDEGIVYLSKLETLTSKAVSYCTYVPLVDGLLIDTGFANASHSLLKARRVIGREPLRHRAVTWGDFSKVNLVRAFLKERGAGYETPYRENV
jgi:hypothetical protein